MSYRPLVSFVIPTYKTETWLGRCLKTIAEQDYRNIEAIVAFDGPSEQGPKIVEDVKKAYPEFNLRSLTIEHGGAPKARNAGFKESKGDIISFLDSDCLLVAGAVRDWVEAFEENPDVSFVYGGYRLMTDSLDVAPSREFDPYLLETNNYIASMFPVKREAVVEWDETLVGLQDWDFWIRVVKNGHKGKFLKDYHIFTRPSYQGDEKITSSTVDNWIDRVNTVKKKNGIPDRKICVSTLGAFYQSIQRAKVLDADYREFPGDKPHKYKMIVSQGFYPFNMQGQMFMFKNAPQDCLKVINWIGTDVWQLGQLKWDTTNKLVKKLNNDYDLHLCNCTWLQKELRELGVKAHVVYQPVDVDKFKVTPLPEKPTVAVYYTDSNQMHNMNFIFDLIQSTPHIHWILFGGSMKVQFPAKNVTCLKWGDVQNVINKSTMLLRLTAHDGFSHAAVQFLVAGRQVVMNTPVPYAKHIPILPDPHKWEKQKADVIDAINKQLQVKASKEQVAQIRDYYKSIASPELYKQIMYEIFEKGKSWVPYNYDREEAEV